MDSKRRIEEVVSRGTNSLALRMVKKSVHSTCVWAVHQPKLPEEAKQLKR